MHVLLSPHGTKLQHFMRGVKLTVSTKPLSGQSTVSVRPSCARIQG